MMIALIPRRASFWLNHVPAFDSLIVPVKGDFAPTEIRAEVGETVPLTIPEAITTLFFGPRG